ncbi:hypothetical protein Goklo_004187 [Gossypium klotzschianum]|uniref:RNase H type-1 domain-containing protein n=1 Tax=Gossypium klotzschianum TaxID=34286 RepID=A0A7J8VN13_9ROSI|nr:hypothetical protein [Gossypium klotzschianum]
MYVLKENIPTVFVAEALACVQGLQLDLDLGLSVVEVEGDALSIVKKLQRGDEDRSKICAYIKDGQRLRKGFQTCKFKHGHQSMNENVHLLVTEGLKNEGQRLMRNEEFLLFNFFNIVSLDASSVTGQSAKPVTMAQDVPHGGLSIRWGTFSPRELAQFKELLEKPVRLKLSWPGNEDMET